jgi:hypothetical protein
VALSSRPVQTSPVACTLDSNAMGSRLDEWHALLSRVSSTAPISGGLRLTFATAPSVGEIARLAEAEQGRAHPARIEIGEGDPLVDA